VKSQIGISAKYNGIYDDYQSCCDDLGLYVISDGLGGHPYPMMASRITCASIFDYVSNNYDRFKGRKIDEELREAVYFANYTLNILGKDECFNFGGKRSASTLDVCLIYENFAHFAHIGDSSAFHYRSGQGLINLFEKEGEDTFEFKERQMRGNFDSEDYIGKEIELKLNLRYQCREIVPGDKIALITDGITKLVFNEEIEECLKVEDSIFQIFERAKNSRMSKYLNKNSEELYKRDAATVLLVEV